MYQKPIIATCIVGKWLGDRVENCYKLPLLHDRTKIKFGFICDASSINVTKKINYLVGSVILVLF